MSKEVPVSEMVVSAMNREVRNGWEGITRIMPRGRRPSSGIIWQSRDRKSGHKCASKERFEIETSVHSQSLFSINLWIT